MWPIWNIKCFHKDTNCRSRCFPPTLRGGPVNRLFNSAIFQKVACSLCFRMWALQTFIELRLVPLIFLICSEWHGAAEIGNNTMQFPRHGVSKPSAFVLLYKTPLFSQGIGLKVEVLHYQPPLLPTTLLSRVSDIDATCRIGVLCRLLFGKVRLKLNSRLTAKVRIRPKRI